MVIAAMKPGISSPSTLIERADLSMDTTLPVKLYRLAVESFASFVAGLSVSLPADGLALCEGPQATKTLKPKETIAVKTVARVRYCVSNGWPTVLLLYLC